MQYKDMTDCAGKIPANQAQHQQQTAVKWLQWYFAHFVVPLLRANFYVTESEACRYEVLYYRYWPLLSSAACIAIT